MVKNLIEEGWHKLFSPEIKVVIVAGVIGLVGVLIGKFLSPEANRYVVIRYEYPNYYMFDTATGKLCFRRGVDELKAIGVSSSSKIINVINKEHLSNSK